MNKYLNWFGVIQFSGMLFSPMAGLIMDWRPQSKENETFGFIVAFCITNSLNVLLNVIVLIPVLQLQVGNELLTSLKVAPHSFVKSLMLIHKTKIKP